MKKYIQVVCCFLLVVVMLAGCSNAAEKSVIEKIKEDGKLVLGTSADWPPYEFHIVEDGVDTIVGFDIEIGKAIAEELGVELVIEDMSFDGLLPALLKNKIDIIIAGMSPTEERKQSVDFSKVYYKSSQTALIHTKDKDKIKSIKDLTGLKIGVQKGAIQEGIAKEQITDAKLEALSTIPDLVLQLSTNKVDAVVCETPVAQAYAENSKDLAVAEFKFASTSEGTAIAINKGNEELVELINKTLDKLIEEGKIQELFVQSMELSQQLK